MRRKDIQVGKTYVLRNGRTRHVDNMVPMPYGYDVYYTNDKGRKCFCNDKQFANKALGEAISDDDHA